MASINLYFAWCWITLGFVSGTLLGIFFYDAEWLGGYGSWRRRMLRLGHIAFIGTGLLNLAFVFTLRELDIHGDAQPTSALFLVGAATMPTICFLSAWKDGFRNLFFIPVISLIAASISLIVSGLL